MRAEADRPPGDPRDYDAVMVFGGAMHADQEDRHPWLRDEKALLRDLLDRGVPLLGVCLGAQLVAEAAGGSARRASAPEIGWHEVDLTAEGARTRCWDRSLPRFTAFQWHSYEFTLPPGATRARAQRCLPAGLPPRQRDGHPVPRRGLAARTPRRGSTTTAPTRTRSGSASTLMRYAGGPAPRSRSGTRLGRALCERFLDATAGST